MPDGTSCKRRVLICYVCCPCYPAERPVTHMEGNCVNEEAGFPQGLVEIGAYIQEQFDCSTEEQIDVQRAFRRQKVYSWKAIKNTYDQPTMEERAKQLAEDMRLPLPWAKAIIRHAFPSDGGAHYLDNHRFHVQTFFRPCCQKLCTPNVYTHNSFATVLPNLAFRVRVQVPPVLLQQQDHSSKLWCSHLSGTPGCFIATFLSGVSLTAWQKYIHGPSCTNL